MIIHAIVLLALAVGILAIYGYAIGNAPEVEGKYYPPLDYPNIQNGDLLFLAGDTYGERICRWCAGCVFSHVGILFWSNGTVYVLDCDLGQGMKDGVRVQKLSEKLARYKGQRCLDQKIGAIRRYKGMLDDNVFLEETEKYKSIGFDNWMLSWVFAGTVLQDLFQRDDASFCSEFIAKVFQDLGVAPITNPASYSPGSFFREFNTEYDEPIYFGFGDVGV